MPVPVSAAVALARFIAVNFMTWIILSANLAVFYRVVAAIAGQELYAVRVVAVYLGVFAASLVRRGYAYLGIRGRVEDCGVQRSRLSFVRANGARYLSPAHRAGNRTR